MVRANHSVSCVARRGTPSECTEAAIVQTRRLMIGRAHGWLTTPPESWSNKDYKSLEYDIVVGPSGCPVMSTGGRLFSLVTQWTDGCRYLMVTFPVACISVKNPFGVGHLHVPITALGLRRSTLLLWSCYLTSGVLSWVNFFQRDCTNGDWSACGRGNGRRPHFPIASSGDQGCGVLFVKLTDGLVIHPPITVLVLDAGVALSRDARQHKRRPHGLSDHNSDLPHSFPVRSTCSSSLNLTFDSAHRLPVTPGRRLVTYPPHGTAGESGDSLESLKTSLSDRSYYLQGLGTPFAAGARPVKYSDSYSAEEPLESEEQRNLGLSGFCHQSGT
ncbi:hypothetical protein BXZ70DRAFT_905760 [Cristinia sonorae]|uniref:Uncharacterized protein n=1 Tax=Cristinia sonorae TaxID=1940300 RepID=A0A8K0USW4_9AGAR|nr:hypothetical protein BXZ70DRAFT_905760 [Cristinia sonorae]